MVSDRLRSALAERLGTRRKGDVADLAVPLVEPEHVRVSVRLPQGGVRFLVGVRESPDLDRLGGETDRCEVKDQSTVGSRTGHKVSKARVPGPFAPSPSISCARPMASRCGAS